MAESRRGVGGCRQGQELALLCTPAKLCARPIDSLMHPASRGKCLQASWARGPCCWPCLSLLRQRGIGADRLGDLSSRFSILRLHSITDPTTLEEQCVFGGLQGDGLGK